MRRFKFTLESVVTVRTKALEDARIQLAAITNVFNKQQEILQEMIMALENIKKESEQYLLSDNFNPSLVSNYNLFSNKINQDILTQKQIIENLRRFSLFSAQDPSVVVPDDFSRHSRALAKNLVIYRDSLL